MSSQPPYTPPGAPGQPYPPAPVRKKTSPIVWILVGLAVFFVLIMLAVAGAGFFFMRTVTRAGVNPDAFRRNPGLASIRVLAAMNPDIEVLSLDENKGVVTVREKKTGKSYTVNFEDAKKGRFSMREDGKEPVTISTSGSGDSGSVEIKSSEGTVKLGSGAAVKVPTWIPDYPGSEPQGTFSAQTNEGESGSYSFKTGDSLTKVAKFYEDGFKQMGMKTNNLFGDSGDKTAGGMISAESGGKTASVLLGTTGGTTTVTITFQNKK